MGTRKTRLVEGTKALRLHLQYVEIEALQRYPANARIHTPEQIDALVASIKEFGFVNPLLIEQDGTIVGGHGRVEAAAKAGLTRVPVIRLAHLSPAQARALRIADNRLAELASWDKALLSDELVELRELSFDMDSIGFDDAEIERVIGPVGGGDAAEQPETTGKDEGEPEPEAPPAIPVCRVGDIWRLGGHRIACNNSLVPETIDALLQTEKMDLVVTDPPYAIYGSSTGVSSSVSDDKMVRPFFRDALLLAARSTRLFAHVYVFCDWRSWASWWEAAKQAAVEPKNLIVWDKGGGGLGANYANTYELIGFFAHLPKQKTMRSGAKRGQRQVHAANLIRVPRVGQDREHNAAKPVALLKQLIENSSDVGARVLDPFLGSGSTLMACEETDRVCYGVELEPGYCDVTIQRWQRATGKQAVLAGSKRTFAEVAAERSAKEPA